MPGTSVGNRPLCRSKILEKRGVGEVSSEQDSNPLPAEGIGRRLARTMQAKQSLQGRRIGSGIRVAYAAASFHRVMQFRPCRCGEEAQIYQRGGPWFVAAEAPPTGLGGCCGRRVRPATRSSSISDYSPASHPPGTPHRATRESAPGNPRFLRRYARAPWRTGCSASRRGGGGGSSG